VHAYSLYSYEAEFIQKLLHEKKKSLVVAFNWTFRYIDDVLSMNNNHFIHMSTPYTVCPSELELKTQQSLPHLLRI
jgi:hypothetical protein